MQANLEGKWFLNWWITGAWKLWLSRL